MTETAPLVQYLYANIIAPPPADISAQDDDMQAINSLPNPPLAKLTADQVYIRQCRLAGDRVDAHGGCFRTADLPKLLQLVQGAPALIGHNRTATATARFFGGSIQQHNGHNYIVPKFYWPRKLSTAEDLRIQIDSALMNEASIAFNFTQATCSICGKDIRECLHEPGEMYPHPESAATGIMCFYYYDGLISVLEGSFVYRGAEPGTGFLTKAPPPPTQIIFDGKIYNLVLAKKEIQTAA